MRNFLVLLFGGLFGIASCQNKNSVDFENQKQIQIESNQQVLDALVKEGDKLTIEREVFHWIYFKTEKDKSEYLKEVQSERFELVSSNKIQGKFPYQLQVKRVDKVDKKSVDEYVIYLWEKALKNNGEYDGWETSVERN